jgi:hypothetical protein
METQQQFIERAREWQKNNPEWELICDIADTKPLYVQWNELQKKVRMSWIGSYGRSAKKAFEEFAVKECKVEYGFLNSKLEVCQEFPQGHGMMVFKTCSCSVRDFRG